MTKIAVNDGFDRQSMTGEQIRVCQDLFRNANSPALNYAEKGFRQKLIDILYKVGYYKYNNSIYAEDEVKK